MSRIGTLIKKAQAYKGQRFKQPKMFVPAGCIVPQTAKDMMAKQLYQAGVITKDDYEKMLGVVYDGEFSREQEVFDDETFSTYGEEFKLSELAEYYDESPDLSSDDSGKSSEESVQRADELSRLGETSSTREGDDSSSSNDVRGTRDREESSGAAPSSS